MSPRALIPIIFYSIITALMELGLFYKYHIKSYDIGFLLYHTFFVLSFYLVAWLATKSVKWALLLGTISGILEDHIAYILMHGFKPPYGWWWEGVITYFRILFRVLGLGK